MYRGHAVTGHNQLDVYRITWDERYWDNAFKAINKGLARIERLNPKLNASLTVTADHARELARAAEARAARA